VNNLPRPSILLVASVASVASVMSFVPARASAAEPAGAACVQASEKGLDARDRGALRAARAHFVTCAADTCPKPMRVDCARWLDEVDANLPSIVVGAKDAHGGDLFDFRVKVDSEAVEDVQSGRPIVLDPGPHVVRFERGRPPAVEVREVKVLLRTGERNRAVLATMETAGTSDKPEKKDDARSSSVPAASWVFGGLGVLALGGFGTFAVLGAQEKARLRTACSPGCTDADVSALRTDYLVADISLGVGIVALGLATYFLLTNERPTSVRATSSATSTQRFARTIWK
jgi:hypothetical protein